MTALSYRVGVTETKSFQKAQYYSKKTKQPIQKIYTVIEEAFEVSQERLAKVQEHFASHRK